MASLQGTRTEQNLLKAFAGESQARMRYDYFANKQKKKDSNKYRRFLPKQLSMRKNTLSDFSSFWKAEWLRSLQLIRPVKLEQL